MPLLTHNEGVQAHGCVSDEDWREIKQYAKANGTRWRAKLRAEWDAGSDEGWKRRLRNTVGPNRLAKVKPPKPLSPLMNRIISDALGKGNNV
jgi:hypothetical protein